MSTLVLTIPLTAPEALNKLRAEAEAILLNMQNTQPPRGGWVRTDIAHYIESRARAEAEFGGVPNDWVFYMPYTYLKEHGLMH